MINLDIDALDKIAGKRLERNDAFSFQCHPELSCFNKCCRNLNLFLYPYDVIRLKNRLGITSDKFIDRHSDIIMRDSSFFPEVLLRMSQNEERTCPFLSESGCLVYPDRPDACRTFPIEQGVINDAKTKKTNLIHFFDSALPYLKASENGVVINFSSIAGITGRSGPASLIFNDGYAAANRGISLLTETWARIGAPQVRVNEIMLGIFETRHGEKTRGWELLDQEQRKSLINHTLLERTGTIEDVVNAVLFVVKDAPFMTGSIIKLDGGYTLGGETVQPMPEGIV